uniref:Uncharacterized protein n=1 Tax=Anguilla anguilla TaxID=7936 RepID=A0A0E9W141_ANGAN
MMGRIYLVFLDNTLTGIKVTNKVILDIRTVLLKCITGISPFYKIHMDQRSPEAIISQVPVHNTTYTHFNK